MRLEEYPLANHAVVGADYEQLKRGFFADFLIMLETHGLEPGRDFRYISTPSPRVEFSHSGAKLHSLSADIAERIRSVQLQTVYCEEPQTWWEGSARGQQTFQTLVGRLRHNERTAQLYPQMQPQGRLSFNPPTVAHWLYDLVERKWPQDGYRCWRMSVRDNYLMAGQAEFIHQIETMYSPDRWAQEIDGNWGTISTGVYAGFDRAKHLTQAYVDASGAIRLPQGLPSFALDPGKPLDWMLDFNVEWMASVVGQWHTQQMIAEYVPKPPPLQRQRVERPLVAGWQHTLCYLFDELFLNDAGVPDVVREFVRRWGSVARHTGVQLFGDPSGNARAQAIDAKSSARSNWGIVVSLLTAAGIRVVPRIARADPGQVNRVNAVKAQLLAGDPPQIGMLIDGEKCPELVNDLDLVQWVSGKWEINKRSDIKRTHLSDSVAYYCVMMRGAQTPIRPRHDWIGR